MQKRVSQPLQSGLDEIGPVFEAGTIVISDDAAMGMIKVIAVSSTPGQVEDRTKVGTDARIQKTCDVSLLTWESKHRTHSSSGAPENLHFSSTEQS